MDGSLRASVVAFAAGRSFHDMDGLNGPDRGTSGHRGLRIEGPGRGTVTS